LGSKGDPFEFLTWFLNTLHEDLVTAQPTAKGTFTIQLSNEHISPLTNHKSYRRALFLTLSLSLSLSLSHYGGFFVVVVVMM
jgi:hypothetical protein